MGTAINFEDLKIWQEARIITKEIYFLTKNIHDYGFNEQIQRAAVSIMNNIAEGYEAGSNLMFKKFLNIAKGSCGEVRSMLYLAIDLDYVEKEPVDELLLKTKFLSSSIYKFICHLNN